MTEDTSWRFVANQKKRHTQDGPNLVTLMKSIGRGLRKVRAIDIGCGDGIITSEIFRLGKATSAVAIDILPEAVESARHNLKKFIAGNVCEVSCMSIQTFLRNKKNRDAFHLVATNPPFFEEGTGATSRHQSDRVARHDSLLGIKAWSRAAGLLLKSGGEFYCIFPSERLSEAFVQLSKNGVEPKDLWWFRADKKKRRFFLRAVRDGKPGLKIHFEHI